MLPHIGTEENCEVKKAYFFCFMVNLLINTVLGRRETDDRDHFGNKRMDLAGPLLGNLFRQVSHSPPFNMSYGYTAHRFISLTLVVGIG
jgi:DNA-directed RNA polymerase beta subunit